MPRPVRMRRVCCMPQDQKFGPLNNETSKRPSIQMLVDEFETIRLLDYEGLKQEEAAVYMNVTRTTVTAIYESARKKMAQALIDGLPLEIKGGHFCLYNESEQRQIGCHWRHHRNINDVSKDK